MKQKWLVELLAAPAAVEEIFVLLLSESYSFLGSFFYSYDRGCPVESFLFFSLFINLVTIFRSCPAGLSLLVCCSASRFDLCLPEPPLYMALS